MTMFNAFPKEVAGLVFNQRQEAFPEPAGLMEPAGALLLFDLEEPQPLDKTGFRGS